MEIKKHLVFFAAALLICCNIPPSAECLQTSWFPEINALAVEATSLYSAPDENSSILASVPEGAGADIISDTVKGIDSYWLVRLQQDGRLGYIPKEDLERQPYLEYETIPASSIQAPSVFILSGNLHINSYEELLKSYLLIPEKIRSQFEADGFHIIMREQDITQEAYADYGGYTGIGQIQGVSDYEKKVIYLQDEYPRQIIHEMGHYINNKWGFSSRDGFKELAEKESRRISVYASSNEREFFCEAFELYIRDPIALATVSPETYNEIVSDLVSLINN